MKKIINKLFGFLLVVVLFTACTDFLDVNKDPNYPTSASTPLLFASGTAWSGAVLGSDVQLTCALWAQHYSQNNTSQQYNTIDVYNLANNSSYFTRYWSSIYSGALPDLKLVISQSEANSEWHYWLAAKVMTAFNFNSLVSLYDKIPFTDALQGNGNLTPVFDDGKKVDAGIIKILDEAIAKKADAAGMPTSMGKSDLVYAGDINNWVKFAKTLKLKVLMRDFAANQSAIQALLTEGDLIAKDAKLTQFTDAENKSNPLFENDRRKLNTTTNIRASATLVSFLLANNDPRIAVFAEPATQYIKPGETAKDDKLTPVPISMQPYYRGLDQGTYGNNTFSSTVFPPQAHSRAVLVATDPVFFLSVAESYFMQAEAWARIGNAVNAKSAYESAVKSAFSRWTVNGTPLDGAPFLATGGAYEFKSASLDEMLKSILTQKWVSSTRTDSWNAFLDICRTGIPAMGTQTVTDLSRIALTNTNYVIGTLAPSVGSVLTGGLYPHRYLFPKTSSDYNPNTPKVIGISEKMWWHK